MANATHGGAAIARPKEPVHPAYVRVTHWINAVAIVAMIGSGWEIYNASPLAIVAMIGSGWEIYNASPLFPFVFPKSITLGGWLAGALLWHFAAMWLLVANGLVYVILGLVTGRFRRRLLPLRPADFIRDLRAALSGRLAYDDLSVYNAVQKALYIGVILAGILIVVSGLSIWKPVQLRELTALFGGYDTARFVHFFTMAAIVVFLAIHVVMAIIVPKSLWAMIRVR